MFKMAKSIKGMLAVVIMGTVLASLFIPVLSVSAAPQAPVDLGSAGNFAVLAETGISTTGTTHITGDIGVSPYAATAITGFGLVLDSLGTFATTVPTSLVTGKVYAATYAGSTPTYVGNAVGDMQTAYTDAASAGRGTPNLNLNGGNIGGLNLTPGLYKWTTGVTIPTNVTLTGSASDVWIFQISGTLFESSGVQVILAGAQASNIFWQVAGQTTLGTDSTMNGNILDQTTIVLNTGATLNGRALAQAAVTLDSNTVINPDLLTPLTYNLTYTAGANGSITGTSSQTVNSGANGTPVTAVPATGYHFVNWSDASTANPRTDTNVTANITVTANFAVNSYTITFNSNGGSAVTAITQNYGTSVSAPTAPTLTGDTFGGWYSDSGLTTPYTFGTMPASNTTLYAKWNVNSYTVTFNNNTGSGTMSPQSANYNTPTALTLNTFTKTGYSFAGWNTVSGGGGTSYADGANYPFTASVTLYAQWPINSYTVTFNNNGGNGVTPTSESATFGQLVTAPTVLPTYTGHAFNGWYTAASGGTLWNFGSAPMGAGAMTLYAQWNLAPTVISTVPANAAIGVAINSAMTATFSTAMNSSTILAPGTFTLKQGATPIGGAVSYTGVTATFQPTVSLAYNTTYTATISTAAQDTAGTHLAAPYVWTFTTQRPVSVGGQAYPINTTTILVSALILAIIVTLGARVLVLRRRAGR